MAITELHRRLDYLVAYSSQLIFVSGESLAQQQGSLQTFIAQQHESTEIAFLNGDAHYCDADYRNNICQQLFNAKHAEHGGSLTDLIGRQENLKGQVLICICAAEHISHSLLQELWDLVIFSRASCPELHLNVILFGQTQWANQAKQWLGENNQSRPILLSNEVIETNQAKESELERLIAQKRAHFAQRIAQRHRPQSGGEQRQSVIQTLWFKLLISGIFLLTFAAILAWQYPQTLTFLSAHNPTGSAADMHSGETPSAEEPATQSTVQTVTGNNASTMENLVQEATPDESAQQTQPLQQTGTGVQPQPSQQINAQQESLALPEDQRRVTNWSDEVEKIQQQSKQRMEGASEQKSATALIDGSGQTTPAQNGPPSSDNTTNQADIDETNPLLLLPADKYVIQLSAMSNPDAIQQFVASHQLNQAIWRYTTIRFGGEWHVIVYSQVFDTIEQGQAHIKTLSVDLQNTKPFIKSTKQVQEEIALADS